MFFVEARYPYESNAVLGGRSTLEAAVALAEKCARDQRFMHYDQIAVIEIPSEDFDTGYLTGAWGMDEYVGPRTVHCIDVEQYLRLVDHEAFEAEEASGREYDALAVFGCFGGKADYRKTTGKRAS